MRLPGRIRRPFPEPQDSSFRGFIHLDEAAFVGSSLKCLEFIHGSFFPCFFAADLLDRSLSSFPVEKLHTDSRTSAWHVFLFDVCDPAVKDSFGWQCSRDPFWHPQKYMNGQPYKYGMARHKVNSSRRYVYGFRVVTIYQRRVHRAKHQWNFQSVALCIAAFGIAHGYPARPAWRLPRLLSGRRAALFARMQNAFGGDLFLYKKGQ